MRRTLTLSIAIFAMLAIGQSRAQKADTSSNDSGSHPVKTVGNIDVLSDTKGVDFRPYLSKQFQTIRANWYKYIPEEARAPQLKSGETTIEFAILKDGKIAGMKIVQPAGSMPMDRAAWGGWWQATPSILCRRNSKVTFSNSGYTSITIRRNYRPTRSPVLPTGIRLQ
jgi:hypothetical protein